MKRILLFIFIFSILNAKVSQRELNNFAQHIINSKDITISRANLDKFNTLKSDIPKLLETIKNKKIQKANRFLAFKKLTALAKILSYQDSNASIAIYKKLFKELQNYNLEKISYLQLILHSLKNSNSKALKKEEKQYLINSLKKYLLSKEEILQKLKEEQNQNIKNFTKLMKSASSKKSRYINYVIQDYKNQKIKSLEALKKAIFNNDIASYIKKLKLMQKSKEESIFQKIVRYWCFFKIEHFDNLNKKEYLDCYHKVIKTESSTSYSQLLLAQSYLVYKKTNEDILKIIKGLEN